jgi:hypothetical protein
VFLKVVTFTADVSGNFLTIGQTDFTNFTDSGVRLLRGLGCNLKTNATSLRATVKSFGFALLNFRAAARFYKLVDCGHILSFNVL